ncbi:glutaredoxin domain-containing protein [Aquimarina algicola]|nr:glutaredoxin domain-containing protein [Aquimarina algicola]
MPELKLYGADWCLKSSNLRNYLQSIWVSFEDFNVETDKKAEETIRSLYDGKLKFPTITYGDDFIKNPSIKELDEFLNKHNIKE